MNSGTQKFNMVATLFKSHPRAERAVKLLQKASFDMKRLLIDGRNARTEAGAIDYCESVIQAEVVL
jgi:hypothetical protein